MNAHLLGALLAMAFTGPVGAGGVVSSKHNLSVSGPGTIKSSTETEVCVFCHGSHNNADGHLNNRPASSAQYLPYTSTTMRSPGALRPTGASKICLSCHDGTIALGQMAGKKRRHVANADAEGRMPRGRSNLGTDLSGTHPFSIRPAPGAEHHAPAEHDAVHLDRSGELQCTSCHDPHREDADPVQGKFLAKSNQASAICVSCHSMAGWSSNPSSHQASPTRFDKERGATTGYFTVADNGCESCHQPHGATTPKRLVKGDEESVCLKCHDGRVSRHDVAADLRKPYSHLTSREGGTAHDASEGPGNDERRLPENRASQARHATCVDCHDPHESYAREARAPLAGGSLAGVWGIDRAGQRVERVAYQYEVCFKCHGDSANKPQARGPTPPETLRRRTPDANLRRVFDALSPSYHPVAAPGRGADVPSLVAPLTTASQVYCTDCHASDSGLGNKGAGPRGPHGSVYPHLLERNLSTADRTVESPAAYALCYKCHDRTVLLSDRSAFKPHARHLADGIPCTACHASHGVSSLQGNLQNNAHLIDFDISIARPTERGDLRYTSHGARAGSCSVSCHGATHREKGY
ncbi:MAG TPA: cytochrome c3 family protein [Myxococcales bacterium]|jgi:predicted CXXCH cytochrome family protein